MKKIFFVGRLVVCGLSLFSCTRAVDTESAKVVIQLPQMATSSAILSKSSGKIEAAVGAMDVAANDEEVSLDKFSADVPANYGGAQSINCYLVGIGGPEAYLNVNFAGDRVNGTIQPNYKFGPFVGLKSATESFELIVTPGEQRVIYIFGFYANDVTACKNIQNGEIAAKSNLTKPYIVGKSEPLKFTGGQEVTVPINLSQPTADLQLDDFVFPAFGDKTILPVATYIGIEKNSFPQNTLRKKSSQPACEPFDIVLKAGPNSGSGILPNPIQASILSHDVAPGTGYSPLTIYTDSRKCSDDVSEAVVTIPAGQSMKRVWTRIPYNSPSSARFSVNLATGVTLNQSLMPASFAVLGETSTKLEIVAPQKINQQTCVPVRINNRSMKGNLEPVSVATPLYGIKIKSGLNVLNTSEVLLYSSAADCNSTTAGGLITSISIPASTSEQQFFFKMLNNNFSNIQIELLDMLANPQSVLAATSLQVNQDMESNPEIRFMQFAYINHFTVETCIPLFLNMYDQKANYYRGTVNPILKIDPPDTNMAGIKLYKKTVGSPCSGSPVIENLGTQVIDIGTSSDQFYIYANYSSFDATNSYGNRTISFKLGDTGPRQKIFFDVQDYAH